jgi:excisionase family DNA binding protein
VKPTYTPIAHTIDDAASLIGVSRATLYRAIADGKLEPRKVRGRTLILRTDLEAYVRGEEVAA